MQKNLKWVLLAGVAFVSSCNKGLQIGEPKINEYFFIGQTEVNVVDWVAYLSDVVYSDPSVDISAYLPDTNKIKSESRLYFRPFFGHPLPSQFNLAYNSDRPQLLYHPVVMYKGFPEIKQPGIPAMSEVPVTGITFEQAQAYCDWRTRKLAELFPDYHLKARLMSPEEFVRFSGLYRFRKKRMIKDDDFKANIMPDTMETKEKCGIPFLYRTKNEYLENKYGNGPIPVALFYSDFLTVYDWFGNVAEMTSQKGIAKGGSFQHRGREANPDNNLYYSGAEEWLGFRCVLERAQ